MMSYLLLDDMMSYLLLDDMMSYLLLDDNNYKTILLLVSPRSEF